MPLAALPVLERTGARLHGFVAGLRRINARVHPCAIRPAGSASITIAGEPAILDQEHCAPRGGPFVITAYVIHAGHAYVFFTYSITPGAERFTRSWFIPLLGHISFEASLRANRATRRFADPLIDCGESPMLRAAVGGDAEGESVKAKTWESGRVCPCCSP
jgi:hypothetical protein